jgi:hypothetical protein
MQYGLALLLMLLLALYAGDPALVRAQGVGTDTRASDYITVNPLVLENGLSVDEVIINGPPTPPPGYDLERTPVDLPESEGALKTLTVPAFNWVFGCSAVSGAMIAGYYDRNGYPNMYTGPTDGGVMPLNNSSWPTWSDGFDTYPNLPLAASHNGVDGRTTKGSIDDYWYKYTSEQDPYVTGAWTQHAWGDAIGDYMKTSHYATYGNTDGSTTFYNWTSSANKLTCADMVTNAIHTKDGTYGRKLFYEARGYTVTDCYSQKTDNTITGGFSFANFKAEIDANRPVMINIEGHTIVGVGYDDSSNTVYIHDTWDYSNHTMTWGGSYSGMGMLSVSIVNLSGSSPTVPTPILPSGTITDTTPTYKWSKVSSATSYRYQLRKGASTVATYTKTVSSSACGSTECTNTPTTTLDYSAYKWRVQAKIGGVWKAYSAFKTFTVAKPSSGFSSQFNGSTAGWSPVNGAWTNYSSMYYRSAGLANTSASAKHTGLYNNFTYEVKMKRTGDCIGCANRMIIRGNPSSLDPTAVWKPSYLFQYSNDGDFSVFEMTSTGSPITLKGWTNSAAVVIGGWNTLKVIANGSSLKYYINGALVWSGTDSTLTDGQVGFGLYRDDDAGILDVDWAKLTVITPSALDEDIYEEVLSGEEIPGGTPDQSP